MTQNGRYGGDKVLQCKKGNLGEEEEHTRCAKKIGGGYQYRATREGWKKQNIFFAACKTDSSCKRGRGEKTEKESCHKGNER